MACRLRLLVVDTSDRILPLKAFPAGRSVDTWLMFVVFIQVVGLLRGTLLSKVE